MKCFFIKQLVILRNTFSRIQNITQKIIHLKTVIITCLYNLHAVATLCMAKTQMHSAKWTTQHAECFAKWEVPCAITLLYTSQIWNFPKRIIQIFFYSAEITGLHRNLTYNRSLKLDWDNGTTHKHLTYNRY